MEHHSNILPWQILCEEKGAVLKVIPVNENGELILSEYKRLLSAKTKLIAITHISNTLGVINDVKEITTIAKQNNIPVFSRNPKPNCFRIFIPVRNYKGGNPNSIIQINGAVRSQIPDFNIFYIHQLAPGTIFLKKRTHSGHSINRNILGIHSLPPQVHQTGVMPDMRMCQ